jgi:hypothetical protein
MEDFRKEIRKIWMIWGALLFSLYLYVKICHILDPRWEPILGANFPFDTLKIILYIVSGLLLILGHYFRNYLLTSQNPKNEANYLKRAFKTNSNPAVVKYSTAVICSIAISLSIGIAGFGMFLLSKDFQTLYILVAIAAIAVIYHRPRMRELENVASTMKINQK